MPLFYTPHSSEPLFHAISIDGMFKRIDGGPKFADAEVEKWRKAGHVSEYIFAARSEEEFERKMQSERKSAKPEREDIERGILSLERFDWLGRGPRVVVRVRNQKDTKKADLSV